MTSLTHAWQVVGTAVAGSSHLRLGLPCQDAVAYCQVDGLLLAAVADGAGSAERSDLGARLAVETAVQYLAQTNETEPCLDLDGWEAYLMHAYQAARQALLDQALDDQYPVREYAATLACLVASEEWVLVGSLGDCLVIAGDAQGNLLAANTLQRGEYANETNFLSQDDALYQVRVTRIEQPVTRLALLSDGLSRLALSLPSHEPFRPFFQPLFNFTAALEAEDEAGQSQAVDKLAAFLSSERVNARTDDDKSLLLAVRPAPAQAPEALRPMTVVSRPARVAANLAAPAPLEPQDEREGTPAGVVAEDEDAEPVVVLAEVSAAEDSASDTSVVEDSVDEDPAVDVSRGDPSGSGAPEADMPEAEAPVAGTPAGAPPAEATETGGGETL